MTLNNEVIFCLTDLIDLFRKKQRWILGVGLITSSICFSFLMLTKPMYEAKGSFVISKEKREPPSQLNSLLLSVDLKEQPNTFQAYMKSKKIMREVIEKLGLQASVLWKKDSLFSKIFRRYRQNVSGIFNRPIEDSDSFFFEGVRYEKEYPFHCFIRFISKDTFEILDRNKEVLQKGELHQKITFSDIELTLVKVPKGVKKNRLYPLHILDFNALYKEVQSRFLIKVDKSDKNVLHLIYKDTNRLLAPLFVNEVMSSYQGYLQKEHEYFSQEQLHYLTKRKEQLTAQFQGSLHEYSKYLTNNIAHFGVMGVEQEAKELLKPHGSYLQKHYQNDLELAKIEEMKDPVLQSVEFDPQLADLYQAMQRLHREKDTLEIAIASREAKPDMMVLDAHLQKIEKVKEERARVCHLLTNIENGSLNQKEWLSKHPENIVFLWVEKLNESSFQKKDIINYLKNTLKVLSVQEKILNERVQHTDRGWQEFDGIDLKTANGLYLSYNQKLDLVQESIQKINYAIAQLNNEQFEISSLGAVLEDSVSIDLIQKGSDLIFQLNDKKNLSDKDIRRIKEELGLIRVCLKEHLRQLLYVQSLQENNWKEKIYGLQTVSLDRINQEISILNQQAVDYVQSKKAGLIEEKKLLENKMKRLREDMQTLPEMWTLEKKLKFQSNMALHMIESMMKLAESKTISYHLNKIGSKPLDLAMLPYLPVKKPAITLLVVGFILGVFLGYLKVFIQAAYQGFQASLENLKALNQNVLGSVSDQCDGPDIFHIKDQDFETIRNISHFIQTEHSQVISLIGGAGPNYGHCLATILEKCGKRVILLDTDFYRMASLSNEEGILQAIKGEEYTQYIRQFKGYDYIPSGGQTRFGNEVLRSFPFEKFIKHLKEKYDIILCFTRVKPTLPETKTYMDLSDKIVISFEMETLKDLSSFFNKDKIGYVKVLRSYLTYKDN